MKLYFINLFSTNLDRYKRRQVDNLPSLSEFFTVAQFYLCNVRKSNKNASISKEKNLEQYEWKGDWKSQAISGELPAEGTWPVQGSTAMSTELSLKWSWAFGSILSIQL